LTTRHLILGTAGHVDHGKTEIVKALTGRDTDRLKEEKERGISIELGFAPFPLDDETFLGIVDVPGHERFVKHMVAGAGGVDLAMLLVAADEGVMPQTEEHMEVLRSLEVGCGVVVISKCDLVDDDMLELLHEEIADLAEGTFLQDAPVVKTSARTGEGLEELVAALKELAAGVESRDCTGPFRQPVDRVFHRKGIGVVVTGSCYSGTVKVGDPLQILPRGRTARVRELQSFNEKRSEGHAGERLAIALQGVKLDEVDRGDMLVTAGRFTVTHTVDARIRLATFHDFEVKNRERLRIHHGAKEVLGRVILLEHDVLRSGDDALVQLKLEKPLVPSEGDNFVLRKYSPPRVVGGGVVIDPSPERHKRRDSAVIDQLKLKEHGDTTDILSKAIETAGSRGMYRKDIETDAGAEGLRVLQHIVEQGEVVVVEGIAFCRGALDSLAETVEELTGHHQARFPLQWGMDKEELRQKTRFPHGTPVFNKVLESLALFRPVFVKGNRVRSATPEVDLPESARQALAGLLEKIRDAGVAFPTKAGLEREWENPHRFVDAVQYLKENEEIIEVGGDGLIHRDALVRCTETLRGLFEEQTEVSVADVKSALGLTRKHAIPLLEMLDDRRVTARSGNNRIMGPNFPE
jgi:selenocysteine-specific elongation factor